MTSVLQPGSRSGRVEPALAPTRGDDRSDHCRSVAVGIFVVAYLFYIGKSLNGPYPKDVLEVPILNTLCLLASSVTVGLAVRALRQGRPTPGWGLVAADGCAGRHVPGGHRAESGTGSSWSMA